MSSQDGQVVPAAAEVYEEFFVPALFQEWAVRVADAAQLEEGQQVLDVACGTGVLAREVRRRVGPRGSVTGIDLNQGMLAVATRKAPEIAWQRAPAEALPFPDDHFDAVVSQFGLMFFEDRCAALEEMIRVLRPNGQLTVAVWDSIERSEGYAELARILQELFGPAAAEALRAPFELGDKDRLAALFAEAGMPDARIVTLQGTTRFPSLSSWLLTEIKGWVLADQLADAQVDLLLKEAQPRLRGFVKADGAVVLASPAHVVTVTKT